MKIVVIGLLLLALAAGGLGLKLSETAARQRWKDYETHVAFVTKLKREGLQPQELEKHEFELLLRRKGSAIDSFPSQVCHQFSLLLTGIAVGVVCFMRPKK